MELPKYPLYGNPLTLIKLIVENQGISLSKIPVAIFYIIRFSLDLPLILIEIIFLSKKIMLTPIHKDPVFIVGHYRTGTTLLYKLMVADKRWGYVNDYDLLFPFHSNWMQRLLKPIIQAIFRILRVKHAFFNDYAINLNDPNEDEGYLINSFSPFAVYWGYIFPRNAEKYLDRFIFFRDTETRAAWKEAYLYNLKKLTMKKEYKRLIIKSPPNTARINVLLELFPDAKFIFIYRNPYHVYISMEKLWKDCIEKYFSLQKIATKDREKIVSSHFKKLMHAYEKDKKLIPKQNLVEIRYETLKKNPLAAVKSIYEKLHLPDFNETSDSIKSRIEREKEYKITKYDFDEDTLDKIYGHFSYFINKWNYPRPN